MELKIGGLENIEGRELRCLCGNLLARLLAGEIELRCRRCKRTITLAPTRGGRLQLSFEGPSCSCRVGDK